MKQLIFSFLLSVCLLNASAQTLYGIVAADTNDKTIGVSCGKDYTSMAATLNTIAAAIGYTVKIDILYGSNLTTENLRTTLDKIQCGAQSKDVIFFYYSGHGVNNQGDFPDMILEPDHLSLEGVHKQLKTKGSRLVITIGDCCNQVMTRANAERGFKVVSVEEVKTDNFKNLFAVPVGDILLSSSTKGECAQGNDKVGGFWTSSWETSLAQMINYSSHPSWSELFGETQKAVSSLNDQQHSVSKINLQDNPVVVVNNDLGDVNDYLAQVSKRSADMKSIRGNYSKYFQKNARVNLYVDDTQTDVMTIEDYLQRVYLNSKKIESIQFIQTKSTKNGNVYETIAVQEIWRRN